MQVIADLAVMSPVNLIIILVFITLITGRVFVTVAGRSIAKEGDNGRSSSSKIIFKKNKKVNSFTNFLLVEWGRYETSFN
jgi:hypothetical protein